MNDTTHSPEHDYLKDKANLLAANTRKLADAIECARVAGNGDDNGFDYYAPGVMIVLLETARRLQKQAEELAFGCDAL